MTPPNFSSNSSDVTPGRLWASTKLLVDKCYETSKEMAGVCGTAFVVRDMMQIVDALGEDGLLRYWGMVSSPLNITSTAKTNVIGHSYGTILGQTAAAMFPNRIDRMVLDGNLNGHEYCNAWYVSLVSLQKVPRLLMQAGTTSNGRVPTKPSAPSSNHASHARPLAP